MKSDVNLATKAAVHTEPEVRNMSPMRLWSSLAILLALQITWSMDRALPNLLVEPIRHSFSLSDKQVGLVVGVAYGVSFGLCGFLAGPLVDMFNRVRLLSGMVLVWSGLTALCGLVTSFPQLLLARIGVGAGESGGTPASYAIIGDIFPSNRRATAIGILKVGTPLGLLCATAIAGTIAVDYSWQTAFLVAGAPGIVLGLVAVFVIPGAWEGKAAVSRSEKYDVRKAAGFIAKAPGVSLLMAGTVMFMFANAGVGTFIMALFQRVHHVPLAKMSLIYGTGTVLSCVSPIVAALIVDRLGRHETRRSLYFFVVLCAAAFVASTVMTLSPHLGVAIGAMMVWQFASIGLSPSAFGVLITLTPARMRGTATGVMSASMYLLGMGPAPFFTGLISDALGGGEMIRYGQVAMGSLNCLCIVLFLLCARSLGRADSRPATAPA